MTWHVDKCELPEFLNDLLNYFMKEQSCYTQTEIDFL